MTTEDGHLWVRVAETTKPLSAEKGMSLKDEMSRLMADAAPISTEPSRRNPTGNAVPFPMPEAPALPAKKRSPLTDNPLEERLLKRLSRGRQPIDGRIDLHGMTQDHAFSALYDFLLDAQRSDKRIVLVITGKGNEGRGVLRNAVPRWFSLPEFRPLVNGSRHAHASHGGEGALYVRIRRRRDRS